MKYFTAAWASGELSDAEEDAVVPAYEVHIEALTPQLPETLCSLATDVNLHDGLIRRIAIERSAARLTIELRCGDLQSGYFDLDLRYSGVDMNSLDTSMLRELAGNEAAEVLYDEVDSDDVYIHRMLFWVGREKQRDPYRELEIRFSTFDLLQVSCLNRDIDQKGSRYVQFNENTPPG